MFCGLILIGIGAFAKHSFPEKNNTMIELSREIEKLKTERIK